MPLNPQLFHLLLGLASASAESSKTCFDFSTKVITPLHAAPSEYLADKDAKYAEPGNPDWATVSGVVNKSIQKIMELLLDPKTIRNGDNTKVVVKEITSDKFLKRIEQSIEVKATFFLTLEWKETWGFALKDGTKETPKSILISYEKTEGTSHIKHMCGNILLQSLKPDQTGVYFYEELKADHRDAQDILNDSMGTLRTLREIKNDGKRDVEKEKEKTKT